MLTPFRMQIWAFAFILQWLVIHWLAENRPINQKRLTVFTNYSDTGKTGRKQMNLSLIDYCSDAEKKWKTTDLSKANVNDPCKAAATAVRNINEMDCCLLSNEEYEKWLFQNASLKEAPQNICLWVNRASFLPTERCKKNKGSGFCISSLKRFNWHSKEGN